MRFTLSGFTERNGFRRFAFDCVSSEAEKSAVIVGADVNLARKHDIRLQDLPLLCLQLLESLGAEMPGEGITLTEERMIAVQTTSRAVAEKKIRKPPRRPGAPAGQAWRNLHL